MQGLKKCLTSFYPKDIASFWEGHDVLWFNITGYCACEIKYKGTKVLQDRMK